MENICNSLKISPMGRGRKPAPEVIRIRTQMFCQRKFCRNADALEAEQRTMVAFTLRRFEIPVHSIAFWLKVNRSTIYSDLQAAQLYVLRPNTNSARIFAEQVDRLQAFILYNARWLP